MYKAGEYIKNFDDNKMKYLKTLDEIPEDTRRKLMRIDDKIQKKHSSELILALIIICLYGFVAGYLLGYYLFYDFTPIAETIAQNTTVIP